MASVLTGILGDNLVGVYLHGSGALGDYLPSVSDLDVLAVAWPSATTSEKKAISDALVNKPCPAKGLEFSLVSLKSIRSGRLPPPFELHVATESRIEVVDGAESVGDDDLILYFEICRRNGETLFGQPPHDVFPRFPRRLLLRMCERELLWIEEHFERVTLESSVLQACRAWRYFEEDVLCSKIVGGEWASRRLDDKEREMVAGAINLKLVKRASRLDPAQVMGFVRRTRSMLGRESEDPSPMLDISRHDNPTPHS